MLFRLWTLVGPRNNMWDRGPGAPWEGAIFGGRAHCNCLPWAVHERLTRLRCCLGYGLRWAQWSMYYIGERTCLGIPDNILPWSVQKWLNRSVWVVDSGGHKFNHIHQVASMCPHGRAHRRNLANTIEPSICGGDAALCQITCPVCHPTMSVRLHFTVQPVNYLHICLFTVIKLNPVAFLYVSLREFED